MFPTSELTEQHEMNQFERGQYFLTHPWQQHNNKKTDNLFLSAISLGSNLVILKKMSHKFLVITEF